MEQDKKDNEPETVVTFKGGPVGDVTIGDVAGEIKTHNNNVSNNTVTIVISPLPSNPIRSIISKIPNGTKAVLQLFKRLSILIVFVTAFLSIIILAFQIVWLYEPHNKLVAFNDFESEESTSQNWVIGSIKTAQDTTTYTTTIENGKYLWSTSTITNILSSRPFTINDVSGSRIAIAGGNRFGQGVVKS